MMMMMTYSASMSYLDVKDDDTMQCLNDNDDDDDDMSYLDVNDDDDDDDMQCLDDDDDMFHLKQRQ